MSDTDGNFAGLRDRAGFGENLDAAVTPPQPPEPKADWTGKPAQKTDDSGWVAASVPPGQKR